MAEGRQSKRRELQHRIRKLLEQSDFESAMTDLRRLPARKVVGPLVRFFHSTDELTKWRAVTAFGGVVAELARKDMASARIVMRRLMWNLNDESGGIGWGSPEAMGEIMARHEGLAAEFAHILVSYIRKDGNYLEYELLQRGVLWGLGRLAQVYPHFIRDAAGWLPPYLDSDDSCLRGMAARLGGLLRLDSARASLQKLKQDETPITLFCGGVVTTCRISRIAEKALSRISTDNRPGKAADEMD